MLTLNTIRTYPVHAAGSDDEYLATYSGKKTTELQPVGATAVYPLPSTPRDTDLFATYLRARSGGAEWPNH